MKTNKVLFAAAAIAIGFAPELATAQETGGFTIEDQPTKKPEPIYTSYVEGGIGYNSADSFKFGEYTGMESDGLFGIGNVLVRRRAAFDSGNTDYYEVSGSNLGLESRSVHLEYGQQGRFKIFFDYDQIPHNRFDDGRTPFNGAGSANLTLPAGWVPGAGTSGFAALDSSLKRVEIETERKGFGGGISWNFARDWKLKGSYKREYKDGLETVAGLFGTTGGNPRSTILPEPIDQTTDLVEVNVAYTGKKLQGTFAYSASFFNNDERSLTWANPFTAHPQWDPSQDYAAGGQGRLGLNPDNAAHNFSLALGYTLNPTTRMAGNFSYGLMLQNEKFLPYTINSSLLVPTPLPREDLDGIVHKYHANVTVTNRPMQKLDLKGQYTFDKRDNDTPRDTYLTVPNDSADQGDVTGDRARVNRPYSYSLHKISADAGYRVAPSVKLMGGYDFAYNTRTFSEVDANYENTARLKGRLTPSPYVSATLGYAGSFRRGSSYESNQPVLDGHSEQHLATLTPDEKYENDPDLRKFYMADRDRHKVSATVTSNPIEPVTLGLMASYTLDDYVNTSIGLTQSDRIHTAVDLSYQATKTLSLSTFFSFDRLTNVQDGYRRSGGDFPPGAPRSTGSLWEVESKDRVYTAGVGAQWQPIKNKLDFRIDYLFSIAFTEYNFASPGQAYADLPDLESRLHSLGVSGGYNVTDSASVRIGYRYEWFRSSDFALDDVNPDTVDQVLALGNSTADYTAHVVGVSVKYKF